MNNEVWWMYINLLDNKGNILRWNESSYLGGASRTLQFKDNDWKSVHKMYAAMMRTINERCNSI